MWCSLSQPNKVKLRPATAWQIETASPLPLFFYPDPRLIFVTFRFFSLLRIMRVYCTKLEGFAFRFFPVKFVSVVISHVQSRLISLHFLVDSKFLHVGHRRWLITLSAQLILHCLSALSWFTWKRTNPVASFTQWCNVVQTSVLALSLVSVPSAWARDPTLRMSRH